MSLIAVHGGAGRADSDPERLAARRDAIAVSLRAGRAVLDSGGSALDAVIAAVVILEDHEDFNAGRGSALTIAGDVEMDASVADGATRRTGAVTVITGVRNPVLAARAVLDDGRHLLLAGPSATEFARRAGLRFQPEEWFVTAHRRAELAALKDSGDDDEAEGSTVGAVALDRAGHLAAATSTGGRRGQTPGRVGDSPVVGAGTWADDRTCAVSATGRGEPFLRALFAHEIDARMRLLGSEVDEAARPALDIVREHGGRGGCIALDRHGRLTMPFTSPVMYRGWVSLDSPTMHIGAGPDDETATG